MIDFLGLFTLFDVGFKPLKFTVRLIYEQRYSDTMNM